MSNRLEDEIARVWGYLDSGKLELAGRSLQELLSVEDHGYQDAITMLRIIYQLELKQTDAARQLLTPYLTKLDDYERPLQAELLALDSRVRASSGEFLKAELSIDRVLDLLEDLPEGERRKIPHIRPDMLNLQGLVLASKGEYKTALSNFEAASMEYRKQDRSRQRAMAQFNQGQILGLLANYDRAIGYLEEAEKIFKDMELFSSLSSTYDQLIKMYEAKQDRDNVYSYQQLKQNLKEKLEFERFQTQTRKERERLQEELQEARMEIKDLKERLFSAEFAVESQKTAVPDNTGSTSLSDQINSQKLEQYDLLEKEKNDLQSKVDQLDHELTHTKEEIEAYKSELDKVVATRQDLAQQMVEIEMLTGELEEKDALIAELQQQTTDPAKLEELGGQLNAQDQETAKLRQQLEQTSKELQEKQQALSDKVEQNKQLSVELEQLRSQQDETEQISNTLESKDQTIEQLRTEIQEKDAKLQALQEKSGKFDEIQARNEQQEAELTRLKEELVKKEQRMNELQEELQDSSSSTQEIEKLQKQVSSLEQSKEKLSTDLRKVESQLDTQKSVHSNLLQERDDKIKELEEELEARSEVQPPVQQEHYEDVDEIIEESVTDTTTAAPTQQQEVVRGNPLLAGANMKPDTSGATVDLETLLASDRVIETVYNRLKSVQSVRIRILAMQLGINQNTCARAVAELANAGVVAYDNSESNPVVTLTE